ncbi:MAG: hypothetical protein ACK44H_09985 [Candidatus Kryptonium sp.]
MGFVARVVNPSTYDFVQSIALRFDQLKFPASMVRPLIPNPEIDGIKRNICHQTYDFDQKQWIQQGEKQPEILSGRVIRQQMVQILPLEMVAKIATYADNFSEWALILGLTDPNVVKLPAAMDASAKELLSRLGASRNHQPAREQLLTFVFEEVYKSYSLEEQLDLIEKMDKCQIDKAKFSFNFQSSFLFKMKLTAFKVQILVARIFANPLISISVGIFTAWKIAKLYSAAMNFYHQYARSYYLPKAVNWIINYAPIQIIPIVSGIIGVIQYIANHQLRLMLIFTGLDFIAGPYKPYVYQIKKVVLLPSTFSTFLFKSSFIIFIKIFGISHALQKEISVKVKQKGEEQRLKALVEKIPDAYQLWMHLMLNPENLYTQQMHLG